MLRTGVYPIFSVTDATVPCHEAGGPYLYGTSKKYRA